MVKRKDNHHLMIVDATHNLLNVPKEIGRRMVFRFGSEK